MIASILTIVLIAFSFAPTSAFGQQHAGNCEQEIRQICPGKNFHKGLWRCINQNKGKLSQLCREKVEKKAEMVEARIRQTVADCRGDIQKYCASEATEHKPGALWQCLRRNLDKLSPQCKMHDRK